VSCFAFVGWKGAHRGYAGTCSRSEKGLGLGLDSPCERLRDTELGLLCECTDCVGDHTDHATLVDSWMWTPSVSVDAMVDKVRTRVRRTLGTANVKA
jgi:hypothetical protein